MGQQDEAGAAGRGWAGPAGRWASTGDRARSSPSQWLPAARPGSQVPGPQATQTVPPLGHSLGPGFAGLIVAQGEVSWWARGTVCNEDGGGRACASGRSTPMASGSPSLPTAPTGPAQEAPHPAPTAGPGLFGGKGHRAAWARSVLCGTWSWPGPRLTNSELEAALGLGTRPAAADGVAHRCAQALHLTPTSWGHSWGTGGPSQRPRAPPQASSPSKPGGSRSLQAMWPRDSPVAAWPPFPPSLQPTAGPSTATWLTCAPA